jgi:hypothetical protein
VECGGEEVSRWRSFFKLSQNFKLIFEIRWSVVVLRSFLRSFFTSFHITLRFFETMWRVVMWR